MTGRRGGIEGTQMTPELGNERGWACILQSCIPHPSGAVPFLPANPGSGLPAQATLGADSPGLPATQPVTSGEPSVSHDGKPPMSP